MPLVRNAQCIRDWSAGSWSRPPKSTRHVPRTASSLCCGSNAQCLDVRDQTPGRVVKETGVRLALPTAALVEQHKAIFARIEEAPHLRRRTGAWPPVQKHGRLTL